MMRNAIPKSPQVLLRQTEENLRGNGLKDALQIGGGRREHRLSHWLVGVEGGAGRIIGDLLQKGLADLVAQSDRINHDILRAHTVGHLNSTIHRVVGDISLSERLRRSGKLGGETARSAIAVVPLD